MRRRPIITHLILLVVLAVSFRGVPQATAAAPKKKQGANARPQLVICVSDQLETCKQLKARLASDPAVMPLASRFSITFLEVDNDPQRNTFVNQFGVKGLLEPPILGFAAADGEVIKIVRGAPQGESLPQLLQEMLSKTDALAAAQNVPLGPQFGPSPKKLAEPRAGKTVANDQERAGADPRLAALREARKLLREKKTADAVALVAPYTGAPPAKDALQVLITSLEKQGLSLVASARGQLAQPQGQVSGAVALVRARRLYGKLPAVNQEIDAGLAVVAKTSQGDEILKQAEALDSATALEEAGQADAAVKAYREILVKYPNTQIATLAAKRVAHLQRAANK